VEWHPPFHANEQPVRVGSGFRGPLRTARAAHPEVAVMATASCKRGMLLVEREVRERPKALNAAEAAAGPTRTASIVRQQAIFPIKMFRRTK
jgi:hypothetical protein